jgi:cobalt-zinc-cadmium efflux system outer membrane protein
VALTLDDLERIALESNPTLVQASMAVQAAQGNYVQAGLYPNPTIRYIADEVGNDGGQGFQGGGVAQEIVTAGKLRLGRAVASHEVVQARLVWETQRRRVLNDVRAGYYDVLLAQKMIEVNEQLLRIGEEGVKATEKLRAAQEVSRADVLQAQIEAESARLNLVEARNFLLSAWRRLAAVLGRPEMDLTPLVGDVEKDLPAFDWKDTLDQVWVQSPELAHARAGIERAQCELARQYAMRVPNLGVGAVVKYDTVSRYTVADVGLSLPLPLFDRNQGRILRAQADLAAARNEVRRVELSLYDRLAAAFEQYATARQRVETYTKTILPNAQKSLDLIRIGYREGEFGYLSLLTAQRTYFGVNLDHLRNLREFRSRCVELEGMLLRGGLEEVKRPDPSVD